MSCFPISYFSRRIFLRIYNKPTHVPRVISVISSRTMGAYDAPLIDAKESGIHRDKRRAERGKKNETERVIKLFTPDQLPFVCIRHVLMTSKAAFAASNSLAYAITLRNKWVCAGKRSPIGRSRTRLSRTAQIRQLTCMYFACERAISIARKPDATARLSACVRE